MPACAKCCASGTPDSRDPENIESNKRRMEFAAEVGCDCFMYMNGRKPEGRPVTRGDIKAAAEGAERWAEYAAQLGLELSYHIHTNLLVDSSEEWTYYMSLLDKAKLCIDVSHAQLSEAVIEEMIKPVVPPELIGARTRFLINPTGGFVVGGLDPCLADDIEVRIRIEHGCCPARHVILVWVEVGVHADAVDIDDGLVEL